MRCRSAGLESCATGDERGRSLHGIRSSQSEDSTETRHGCSSRSRPAVSISGRSASPYNARQAGRRVARYIAGRGEGTARGRNEREQRDAGGDHHHDVDARMSGSCFMTHGLLAHVCGTSASGSRDPPAHSRDTARLIASTRPSADSCRGARSSAQHHEG